MKNGVFICLLFIFVDLKAQKIDVTWGEEGKRETYYQSFIKGVNNETIKFSFDIQKKFLAKPVYTGYLTKFNANAAEIAEQEIIVEEEKTSFGDLLNLKNNIYMFSSQYVKEDKVTNYFYQKIDIKTLKNVGKITNIGSFVAIKKSSQSTIDVEASKDSSKLLVFGLTPYKKKENEKYYMAVYDYNMAKQWEKTVELPYLDKFVDVVDYLVTNEGDVCVIIKHYDKEVKKESIKEDGEKVPAYKTKLLLYQKGVEMPLEYILDIGNKYVHTLQLSNDNMGDLVLFGMYKTKYNGYVTGYFIANFDKKTKQLSTKKMYEFDMDLLDLIKKDKQGSNKEKDPGLSWQFSLKATVDRNDGSRDYILEYYNVTAVTRSRGGMGLGGGLMLGFSSTYYIYSYGDIVDINIKSDGKVLVTRIPKLQVTTDIKMYSSFIPMVYKDKLLLFYNDDEDNIDRDLTKRPDDMTSFKKSSFAMATIDKSGNLERKVVYSHREMKLVTCVRECCILAPDRIGMYANKNAGVFSAAKDMVGILTIK